MIDWQEVKTVFLDMDGTLLDLNFDNHFWQEFVPLKFSEKTGLSIAIAKRQLAPRFKAMEGKLEWYCLDYWSSVLELDISGLKAEVSGLIRVLPHVMEFLETVRSSSRQLVLVTNAHGDSLQLKMEKTCLHVFFDLIISSHEFGLAKEQQGFWQKLQERYPFESKKTLLVDDSVSVLNSAKLFGIKYLVSVKKPDSTKPARQITDFPAIEDFRDLMPGLKS